MFADNSKESEPDPKADESVGRSYLLHTADDNLTSETDAPVDDQDTCHDRLLERVASLPNLARALLFVARNKGAAGVDGVSTEEVVEAAPDLLSRIREALISGMHQRSDIRAVWLLEFGRAAMQQRQVNLRVFRKHHSTT